MPVANFRWSTLLLALFLLPALTAVVPARVEGRSSIWISSRDQNSCIVSAVFQYDEKMESELRRQNDITNAVLQIDIHTRDPAELCKMLVMAQGPNTWMPLVCLTGVRGNIYSGYLILPEEFDLGKDIEIRLGDRTVSARFVQQ